MILLPRRSFFEARQIIHESWVDSSALVGIEIGPSARISAQGQQQSRMMHRTSRLVARSLPRCSPCSSSPALRASACLTLGTGSRNMSTDTTDFGYKNVGVEEKQGMVRDVFSKVAAKYDVMNDVMSFGAHRLWKDELVNMMGFPAAARADPTRVPRHLDVAGGTGDVAFRSLRQMSQHYGSSFLTSEDLPQADRQVVVCDINPEMLQVGRERAAGVVGADNLPMIGFVEGNAEKLPFDDASFDVYTIAFGLRNVTHKDAAIAEAYRVLRKGGRLLVLEFSHVQPPLLQQAYDQFSFHVIPQMGQMVAGDAASYQYLVESIRRFPKQQELLEMLQGGGFRFCSYTNFTFGVVAVHSGFKL